MTRRHLLGLPLAMMAQAQRLRVAPSELFRYADPVTESEVTRLTDPRHACLLPPASRHPVSTRNNSLLYVSDRGGTLQAWRMDLKSGESRCLTDAARLQPGSVAQSRDERLLMFADGPEVRVLGGGGLRARLLQRVDDQARLSAVIAPDGQQAAVVEATSSGSRVRVLPLLRPGGRVARETDAVVAEVHFRPRLGGLLVREETGGVLLQRPGTTRWQALSLAAGSAGPVVWTADGQSLFYLHRPPDRPTVVTVREHQPDEGLDRAVTPTTQFRQFARNGDASVFVGASGSVAAPHVLLALRSVRRELTLCEHRASTDLTVEPQFTPNSRRVLFQSDRDGKAAIYLVDVERLVEETEVGLG